MPTLTPFQHGYALLIGVGRCQYDAWSLPVTAQDAQALRNLLVDPALCAYPDDENHLRPLHDEGATGAAILDSGNIGFVTGQIELFGLSPKLSRQNNESVAS